MQERSMHAVRSVLVVLGVFLLVFLAGVVIAWAVRRLLTLSVWASGLLTQLVFLCLSLALMSFIRGSLREFGFKLVPRGLIMASLASIVAASAIMGITILLLGDAGGGQPEIAEDPLALAILSLLVAPICEEIFFRGLLQGYLILKGHKLLSIAVPAVLFSLVHVLPFSSANVAMLVAVLIGAVVLGSIAGYFRAINGSLLHPILVHFWFNLIGCIIAAFS